MEDEEPVFNTAKERDYYYKFGTPQPAPEKKKKPRSDPKPEKVLKEPYKYTKIADQQLQLNYKNDYSKANKRQQVRLRRGAVVRLILSKSR